MRYRARFIGAALAAAVASLILGFSLSPWSGYLLAALAAVAVLYPVRLIGQAQWEQAPIRSLAEVPGSKDIFMALGWGALIVVIPLAAHRPHLRDAAAVAAALVLVVGLVFVRALLRDFRDIQADRLIGRETLPMVLGVERTRKLLYASIMAVAGTLVIATALGLAPAPIGYLLLAPLAYAAACVPLFTRQAVVQGFGAESIIDAAFLITGLVALFG
jgi:4-hydroxy-3-methylbut-2-enyl diphosphate reductase